MRLRLGTRASPLALAQTQIAGGALRDAGHDVDVVHVRTRGDRDTVQPLHLAGRPGVFTVELEEALTAGEIDVAVHSLKDMPLVLAHPVAAVLPRGPATDTLLVHPRAWHELRAPLPLAEGARVGSSSPRRQAQVLDAVPDAVLVDVRGNVGTRIDLLEEDVVDALVVATSGLERLGIVTDGLHRIELPLDAYPTCPGQGAIALQAVAGTAAHEAASALEDPATRRAVDAERALLARLGGGCGLPLGAAWTDGRLVATMADDAWLDGAPLRRAEGATVAAVADGLARPGQARKRIHELPDLRGQTVVLAFDEGTAAPYLRLLRESGAHALAAQPFVVDPTNAPPPEDAWRAASWAVVTSARAVEPLAALARRVPNPSARLGAVGPATARAMRRAGLPVHLVSPDGTGAGLARVLLAHWPPEGPVLFPAAERASPDLPDAILGAGHRLVHWPVYRLRATSLMVDADVLVVGSPTAVDALSGARARRWVAFGPATGRALRAQGLPCDAVC
ncbi:MAG TPA: hydroxymethylbilane synthase, partial [Candidatus Thermoplasmatota archaeon]|nr:hydroxymethylbilane synthase [Candidatus Thermoplasmatota archaeon]